MKLNVTADSGILKAANELKGFGFELAADGTPVSAVENADNFTVSFTDGKYEISAKTRTQVLYALKYISDSNYKDGIKINLEPAFEELTFMLDCSRNAVAKKETVKKLVRYLAVLGYKNLMLYTEDTYKVESQPYFGYLRNPYTAADIREIDAYCSLFGIELIPCIQTLAHFNAITRHDVYHDDLFDCNDILLVGEEKTYEFLSDLLSFCAENFSSKRIHIGMDEAHMLGRGKYLDKNGYVPRTDIMKKHLERVISMCAERGMRPMMWSDMFLSPHVWAFKGENLDDLKAKVPKGVDLVYWDYYSKDEKHYLERLEKHRMLGNDIIFAGGAWKWEGYTPDNKFSIAATSAAAKCCADYKVKNFILTAWGDNGGECSPFAVLPAIAYLSSFNYGGREVDLKFTKSFLSLTGLDYDSFMTLDLADRITSDTNILETNCANKYLLFNDILLGTMDTTLGEENLEKLYFSYAKKLKNAARKAGGWKYLFDTQYALCNLLSIKSEAGKRLRKAYKSGDKNKLAEEYKKLLKLPALVERFYNALYLQWHKENRPNGFDVQDIRIGALKQRIAAAIKKVKDYLDGKTESIPELEEELLCRFGGGKEYKVKYDHKDNSWIKITSVNVND